MTERRKTRSSTGATKAHCKGLQDSTSHARNNSVLEIEKDSSDISGSITSKTEKAVNSGLLESVSDKNDHGKENESEVFCIDTVGSKSGENVEGDRTTTLPFHESNPSNVDDNEEPNGKRRKRTAKEQMEEGDQKAVFIGNLNYQTKKRSLKKFLLKNKLNPTEVIIIVDARGESKGYGYAHFETHEQALECCSIEKKSLDGRELNLNLAARRVTNRIKKKDKGEVLPDKKERNVLFAYNMSFATTGKNLRGKFAGCTRVKMHRTPGSMHNSGTANLYFKAAEKASKALLEQNGIEVDGRRVWLRYNAIKGGKPAFKRKHKKRRPKTIAATKGAPRPKMVSFGDDDSD